MQSCHLKFEVGDSIRWIRVVLLSGIALLCVASRSLALSPATPLDRYARQVWSTETGLPQNSVHSILQTSDGFLWLGTEAGLARFDGYQFKVFDRTSAPALPGDDIRCLLEDNAGGLWVGTASGLTRLHQGSARTFTVQNGLPAGPIKALAQTRDGRIWVLTADGLASAGFSEGNDAGGAVFIPVVGLDGHAVRLIASDGSGGLWAASAQSVSHIADAKSQELPRTSIGEGIEAIFSSDADPDALFVASSRGIFRLQGDKVAVVAQPGSLPAGGVRSLLAAREGVWAVGRNSVSLFPLGRAGSRQTLTFTAGSALPGTQVLCIFADRHGTVWIGTNGGLARFVHGQMERATEGSGAVLSIFEDQAGDLWVGTETDGVRVLRDRAFQLLDPLRQSPDVSPTSVVQSADGNIWVGTSGAGVFLANQVFAGKSPPAQNRELSTETVLALASGGQSPHDLWVGTSSGLNLLHQGRWKSFTSADGLADDFIRSLLPSRDGSLWIGTQHGLSNLRDGHAKTFTTAQGLGSNLIGPMLEAPNGDLWIGTFGGLSRLHAGVFRNFTVADGLPGNTVTALALGANGTLGVGTRGQGLARWDGSRFINFSTARSIPSEIYALIDDGVGSLWMTSEHGIFRVSIRDLEAVSAGSASDVPVISYGSADGVPSVDTAAIGYPSAWRLGDDRLCFVTRRGVVVVDPALTRRSEKPPPVVLEEIAIDDRIVTPEQMASLAPGPLHFSFSFAGIDLSAPQRVQYRYMLEGLDRDWVYAGTRRVAYYTSIPHGHYRFRVSARDELGGWSEPAQLSFELRPRLYQTLWFRALLGLLLLAIGVGLYALRVRRLRSRFDMVSAERNRLAREIHDTLAQSFVAVSMRLEIMSQMLRKSSAERPDVLPDRFTEQLDQTRGLVRDSIEEARRSIWDLRSEGAGAQSLPARLARVVQEATARGQLARMETTGTFRPLEQPLEDELCRIAQEAVNNSVRHARAQSIRLRLAYELDSLSLEVRDNGQGFDPNAVASRQSGHYGLTGIRERASLIGAEVMLGSVIGEGTTVRVTLPLTQGRKHAKRRTL